MQDLARLLAGQSEPVLGDGHGRVVDEPVLVLITPEGGGRVRPDPVLGDLLLQQREDLHLRQIVRAAHLGTAAHIALLHVLGRRRSGSTGGRILLLHQQPSRR